MMSELGVVEVQADTSVKYEADGASRLLHVSRFVLSVKTVNKKGGAVYLTANDSAVLTLLAMRSKAADRNFGWFWCPCSRHDCYKSNRSSYRPLSDVLSWMSSTAIRESIRRLENAKLIQVRRAENRSRDSTNRYLVSDEVVEKLADETDWLWFNPDDADALGLNSALVLNLIYREVGKVSQKAGADTAYCKFRKARLAEELMLPDSTVKSCFTTIEKSGLIRRYRSGFTVTGGLPAWSLAMRHQYSSHVASLGEVTCEVQMDQLEAVEKLLVETNALVPLASSGLKTLVEEANVRWCELLTKKQEAKKDRRTVTRKSRDLSRLLMQKRAGKSGRTKERNEEREMKEYRARFPDSCKG